MKFPDPLIRGRLARRYKRFLADVELENGQVVVAHCANPGSMLGLAAPGSEVWLSPSRNPDRKLKFSWELVAVDGHLVGINTALPNGIVEEAIQAGAIAELTGYASLRREVRYGRNSRIDILLEHEGRPPCYVEVKNVHLKRGAEAAEFPDSVTTRGTKHLVELAEAVEAGSRSVMVYLVQRGDCSRFEIAADIDPEYDRTLRMAMTRGVEALCYSCKVGRETIEVDRRLPLAI
ncbi:MAG TPA: DNA/RNA nuclease SfsA [Kiloniellales bacterium]|jgi:sugar fermentation stimulation protein A